MRITIYLVLLLFINSCASDTKDKDQEGTSNPDPEVTEQEFDAGNFNTVPHNFKGEKPLARPREIVQLNKDTDGIYRTISFKKDLDSNTELWIIISDRNENNTYLEPDSKKIYKKLQFKEKLYVVNAKQDWLRVVKTNKSIFSGDSFDESVEDYGWIHKDKVLYWKYGIKNKLTGVNIKTLTINTSEQIKKENFSDIENVTFYKNPDLSETDGEKTPLYRVFYLYKQEENAYLIGTEFRINPRGDYDEIMGWVSKDRFIIWDSRIALEPSWENQDPSKYSFPKIFSSKGMAVSYNKKEEMHNEAVIYNSPKLTKRLPGTRFRFPVFENENGIIHTGVVGSIKDARGVVIDPGAIDSMKGKLIKIVENLRNVNVLFVVDFTNSMAPYIPKVSEAINSTIPVLKAKYEDKVNIKFSIFGYRDLVNGSDSKMFERPPFTFETDGTKIKSFLDGVQTYSTEGHSEKLFKGIDEALEWNEMEKYKYNTNIIVVVGDAGNKNESYSNLVDKFNDYNCHLVAYQVKHLTINEDSSNPYDNFVSQLKNIILEASKKKSLFVAKSFGNKTTPHLVEEGEVIFLKDSHLQARIIKSKPNSTATANDFRNFIELVISDAGEKVDELAKAIGDGAVFILEDLEDDDNIIGGNMTELVEAILANNGIDKSTLDLLKKKKYQFVQPGYAAYQPKDISKPIFKYSLYLNATEITDIRDDLKKFSDSRNKRYAIYDAFQTLLAAKIGEDVAVNYSDPRDITSIIFGLPSESEIFKGLINIEHLLDETMVKDWEIDGYWSHINNCREILDDVINKRVDCPFLVDDGIKFYWIPQEYLP